MMLWRRLQSEPASNPFSWMTAPTPPDQQLPCWVNWCGSCQGAGRVDDSVDLQLAEFEDHSLDL